MALAFGCATHSPPKQAPPAAEAHQGRVLAEPRPARAPLLPDAAWGSAESVPFRFRIELPDRAHWKELDDARWFALEHAPSRSTLRLRVWTAPMRVVKEECRQQVYLWRPELRPASDPALERSLPAPEGYDVGLRVDLFTDERGGRHAVALAYGAATRRCYAASLETPIDEHEGEAELGARLRLISEGTLAHVEIMDRESLVVPRPFE